MGDDAYGINRATIERIVARGRGSVASWACEVGVVIGGGNIFRGVAPRRGRHGPRHRRLHGHAGHRDERARAGRTRCASAGIDRARACRRSRIEQVVEPYIRGQGAAATSKKARS